MAKTQEELNELIKELESMNKKLSELDDNELNQISGGKHHGFGAKYSAVSVILLLLIKPILARTPTVSGQDIERFEKLLKENKIDEACKFVLGLEIPDRDKKAITRIINTYVGNI
ncbi:MAG: bacteriocin [Firmicutes bacterium]|nr:bacteriocin [Candidatus Colivicinus equi]